MKLGKGEQGYPHSSLSLSGSYRGTWLVKPSLKPYKTPKSPQHPVLGNLGALAWGQRFAKGICGGNRGFGCRSRGPSADTEDSRRTTCPPVRATSVRGLPEYPEICLGRPAWCRKDQPPEKLLSKRLHQHERSRPGWGLDKELSVLNNFQLSEHGSC